MKAIFALLLPALILAGCGATTTEQAPVKQTPVKQTPTEQKKTFTADAEGIMGGDVSIKNRQTGERWTLNRSQTNVSVAMLESELDQLQIESMPDLQSCKIAAVNKENLTAHIKCENLVFFVGNGKNLADRSDPSKLFDISVDETKALWLTDGLQPIKKIMDGKFFIFIKQTGDHFYFKAELSGKTGGDQQDCCSIWQVGNTPESITLVHPSTPIDLKSMEVLVKDKQGYNLFEGTDQNEASHLYILNWETLAYEEVLVDAPIDINSIRVVAKYKYSTIFTANDTAYQKQYILYWPSTGSHHIQSSASFEFNDDVSIFADIGDGKLLIDHNSLGGYADGKLKIIQANQPTIVLDAPFNRTKQYSFSKIDDADNLFRVIDYKENNIVCERILALKNTEWNEKMAHCGEYQTFQYYPFFIFKQHLHVLVPSTNNIYKLLQVNFTTGESLTISENLKLDGQVMNIVNAGEYFLLVTDDGNVDQPLAPRYYSSKISLFKFTPETSGITRLGQTPKFVSLLSLFRPLFRSTYSIQFSHTLINGRYFFQFMTKENGIEPWITDGTLENTKLLVDSDPGPTSGLNDSFYAVVPLCLIR